MREKTKSRLIEFAAAFVSAALIILFSQFVADKQRALTPASAWFQINEIFVPDHKVGDDAAILYDVVVLDEFESFRIVEVQRQSPAGVWASVCAAATVEVKDPRTLIENKTVSWQWLTGDSCALTPNVYRLRVTFAMSRPGWPAKRAFTLSNTFTVSG